MANERIALLQKSGGKPSVRVTIGQAQWGSYAIYLTTKNRQAWETGDDKIWKGHSWDEVEASHNLGMTPNQLDGRELWVDMIITPVNIGDPYAATIEIMQKGLPVEGGQLPPMTGDADRRNFKLSTLVRLVAK